MNKHLFQFILIILISLCHLSLFAAEDEGSVEALNAVAPQELDIEQITSKISTLKSISEPNQKEKQRLEFYLDAMNQLKAAQREAKAAARFKQSIDRSATEQSQLGFALNKIRSQAPPPPKTLQSLSIDELEQRLNQSHAEQSLVRNRLAALEARLINERLRPEQAAAEIARSRQQIEQLAQQLRVEVARGGEKLEGDAMRVSLLASQQTLKSRIDRLEMERLSHAPRLELLNLKIDFAREELKQSERETQQFQDSLSEMRSAVAEQRAEETAAVTLEATDKHPLIQQAAEMNQQLSARLRTVIGRLEDALKISKQSSQRFQHIDKNLDRAKRQLDISEFDETFDELLRTQRNELPDIKKLIIETERNSRMITAVRLEQFKIEDQRQRLIKPQTQSEIVVKTTDDMTAEERSLLQKELDTLAADRLKILDELQATTARYEQVLNNIDTEQEKLIELIRQYTALLERHLIWIPSAAPLTLTTLAGIGHTLKPMLSGSNWIILMRELFTGMKAHPVICALSIASFVLLLYFRRSFFQSLQRMEPLIGNVRKDSIKLTFKALAGTFLLAFPWVLLTITLSGLLLSGETVFANAVSIGLARAAAYIMLIQLAYYIFIPHGLAEVHFRWEPSHIALFRQNLGWLLYFLTPIAFFANFADWLAGGAFRDEMSRLIALLGVLIIGFFVHRIFNPWTGIWKSQAAESKRNWSLHKIWYPLAIGIYLLIGLLTVEGYFYTAYRLHLLIFLSICALFISLMFYYLAERWLLVTERRLALARAKAKRQALLEAKAAKEAAEAAGEVIQDITDQEILNLARINEQTRRLLRWTARLTIFIALWVIWSQLTPAFGELDEIPLWQHSVETASGTQELIPVSLYDLLLSLLIIVLMLVAGRNLPGLMEIALLQPMALDSGTRYAIVNISRYLIYTAGILFTLSMIGIAWSDVQWLVAAMGVGLGFGLQEIFANFISGIMILFERPIRIGDTVTIGNISGTVARIRIRATTITDWDNKELVVPNKTFITDPLINWTLSDPTTRIRIPLGIAYGSDTAQAHRIMMDVITSHPDVLDEPSPTAFFLGFGESSLDFELFVFVAERIKRLPLTHDLHMRLDKGLREAGIEIPFPQRDLHLRSADPGIDLPGGSS